MARIDTRSVAAINCMDGRVQSPIADWVKIHQHVQYVDVITEAGADGVMARGAPAQLDSIKQRVLVSVNAHHSSFVAIAGHHGCAGNPVSESEHVADIRTAVAVVTSWQLPIQLVGLWLNEWGYVWRSSARGTPVVWIRCTLVYYGSHL